MTTAIELNHVSKGFKIYHEQKNSIFDIITSLGNRKSHFEFLKVLDDITFSIEQGETFGIMGINGSGKTTLLKLISKIYRPDSGEIKTRGNIVPLLQLGIGFHPELTPIDNIITYGILLGFERNHIKSLIPEILEYAELEKFADVKIKNFSTGMFARLAFSTSLVVDPDILVIDEVLAVGDIFFRNKCIKSIEDFTKRKKTILIVSHDSNTLLNLCDRIMILNHGKIEKIGPPQEVVSHYLKSETKKDNLEEENQIGSHNYRAFVGSAEKYDLLGATQFNLMTLLGLREHHYLLDIGCGSLGGGRLFIPYLLPNRYFGIEPQKWLLKQGIKQNLGNDIVEVKHPQFHNNSNFNFKVFQTKFDFILAQSIFSHASEQQIRKCLSEAKKVMKPKSIFLATYLAGEENYSGDSWKYPDSVTYTKDFMNSLVEEFGFSSKPLKWKHPNGQSWMVIVNPDQIDKIPNL